MNPVTSEADVEQIALDLFEDMKWSTANVIDEANREIYRLLKDGIQVRIGASEDEADTNPRVHVIDWVHPEENELFVAQQLWVQGETYLRRTDLVGFVNGLPLVFIELKGINHNVENAYRQNFHDYLSAVPQLFWFNAIVILSNGFESRVGSLTGEWDHFKEWKRIEREDEPPRVSLEVILRGLCEKSRLLECAELRRHLPRQADEEPHADAEAATVSARTRVDAMVRLNPTRESLRGQLEALIADYNDGAHTVDQFFKDLIEFMKKVEAEESRAGGKGLSQEELAMRIDPSCLARPAGLRNARDVAPGA